MGQRLVGKGWTSQTKYRPVCLTNCWLLFLNPVYVNANPATDGPLPCICPAASPWSATHTQEQTTAHSKQANKPQRMVYNFVPYTRQQGYSTGNIWETSERQGGVHMGLYKHTDTILNGPKLNWHPRNHACTVAEKAWGSREDLLPTTNFINIPPCCTSEISISSCQAVPFNGVNR